MQPSWNLRDLGLTDLGVGQLDELVDRLLPYVTQKVSSQPSRAESNPWKASYLSTDSFFHNKYGEETLTETVNVTVPGFDLCIVDIDLNSKILTVQDYI